MNPFKGSARQGHTPQAVTPYQKAAQAWDERMGSTIKQARVWRYAAFISFGLAGLATVGLLMTISDSRITPYVIEVTSKGEVRAVGNALAPYEPKDAQIAHHLGQFIEKIRSLSTDPIVVRQNWLKAYELVTDRAATKLNAYARDNDPFENVGRASRNIEITSVVRITDASFEARWRETAFENGAEVGAHSYTGIFTLVHVPPTTEPALRANPLGLYIHDFNWSLDFIGEN